MSKWISVENKLPKNLDKVLVAYHPYDDKKNDFVFAVCVVNEYLEFFSTEAEEYIEFVTHWMPLPESPKEQNND